jgi:pimeloyl-ACP methyl ester carboxylesterase
MKRSTITYESADGTLNLHAELVERDPVERDGAPLSVLCLHGLTRNGRDFESLVTHLSHRYRVITADQRGRGLSARDPNPANYQVAVYARDMARLLEHLEIERVVLIGTSMGGIISMVLAATQPERVRGIVLNDIGPEIPASGLNRLRQSLSLAADVRTWADAANQARRVNGPAFPDYADADWLAFARRIYREDGSGRPVLDYDPVILSGLNQAAEPDAVAPTLWPLWTQLHSIPILAVRGGLSDILSAEILERMAATHPSLTALTLSNRGHAPMLDEPAAVAAIDAFLRSLEP